VAGERVAAACCAGLVVQHEGAEGLARVDASHAPRLRWIARARVVVAAHQRELDRGTRGAPCAELLEGPLRPPLYAAEGAQQIIQYDAAGHVVWTHPASMSRDASRLPNGNTLFCYNEAYDSKRHDNPSGVREVTTDHRVVFDFRTTGQVWSCQRLADGSTLVAAASQGKLLVVDRAGTVVDGEGNLNVSRFGPNLKAAA